MSSAHLAELVPARPPVGERGPCCSAATLASYAARWTRATGRSRAHGGRARRSTLIRLNGS